MNRLINAFTLSTLIILDSFTARKVNNIPAIPISIFGNHIASIGDRNFLSAKSSPRINPAQYIKKKNMLRVAPTPRLPFLAEIPNGAPTKIKMIAEKGIENFLWISTSYLFTPEE